jgi:hypothetical protein
MGSMLDFESYRLGKVRFETLIAGLDSERLADLSVEMVDDLARRLDGCLDADVIFEPVDPEAHDPYAADPSEIDMPWTLGHVIVHVTASSEESAALAAEMARGVPNHDRSRWEVPWREARTIEACQRRLAESLRMRLASLKMWPDPPHLDVAYAPWRGAPTVNAIGRFVLGLAHEHSHLEQIDEIIRQAKQGRG